MAAGRSVASWNSAAARASPEWMPSWRSRSVSCSALQRAVVQQPAGLSPVDDLTRASSSWCTAFSLSRTSCLVLPEIFRRLRFPSGVMPSETHVPILRRFEVDRVLAVTLATDFGLCHGWSPTVWLPSDHFKIAMWL